MVDDSRIEGMDHLLKKLGELPSLVQRRRILARSLRNGPLLIAQEAERRAPVDTGRLARNMVVTVTDQTASEAIAKIGPARSAFYGIFSELGTVKMAQQEFLGPAYNAKIDEAVAVIGFDLGKMIEEAATD